MHWFSKENVNVNKLCRIALLCVAVLLVVAPAWAADAPKEAAATPAAAAAAAPVNWTILAGASFGAGMVILGAAYGSGKIGSSAVESMARQPEVAGNIQTAMVIAAVLIEGATFFALIVCIINAVMK
jgi:F-type H+-transporting ATPase subunit c